MTCFTSRSSINPAREDSGVPRFGGRCRFIAAAALTALALAFAPVHPVCAQDNSYDSLIVRALAAFDADRWDEARQLFERAHGLDPTARTLRTIGMSAFNQGDYVAALQNLEAALVDPRKPLTDAQHTHVSGLIERANSEIGRFRLQLQPAESKLLVDGKSPVLISHGQLVLTPGRHELVASAPGYQTLTRVLDVQANDRAPLHLSLLPGAEPPLAAPAPTSPQAASPAIAAAPAAALRDTPADVADGSGDRSVWGTVAVSFGAASLVASGVSTVLALGQKSDLEGDCPNQACPPAVHDRVDRYDTLRIVSVATLAAGVIGVGLGVFLLLGSDAEPEAAQVRATIAPGFVGVSGRL